MIILRMLQRMNNDIKGQISIFKKLKKI